MQMLLESRFFCTQQVTKRLHSGEAATAGEDGVTKTVIKSLRGGRGGRQRVFAASSLDGAAWDAAMEAGGGAVAALPPKKEQFKDRPAAGRRGRTSVTMTPCAKGVAARARARAASAGYVRGPLMTYKNDGDYIQGGKVGEEATADGKT
jgi:hypothetical protein